MAILNFKVEKYYQLRVEFETKNTEKYIGLYFDSNENTKFPTKEELEKKAAAVKKKRGKCTEKRL